MQDVVKKNHEDDLKELRLLFLGSRYDNRPHYFVPTSESDLLRMERLVTGFEAHSLEFTNACKKSLTSSACLRLPKWRGLNDQEFYIVVLNNEELHALLRLQGQINIQEPPLQTEEASELPQPIPCPCPVYKLSSRMQAVNKSQL
jgi:hypothetical protein